MAIVQKPVDWKAIKWQPNNNELEGQMIWEPKNSKYHNHSGNATGQNYYAQEQKLIPAMADSELPDVWTLNNRFSVDIKFEYYEYLFLILSTCR